jgi:hypothetical protein
VIAVEKMDTCEYSLRISVHCELQK